MGTIDKDEDDIRVDALLAAASLRFDAALESQVRPLRGREREKALDLAYATYSTECDAAMGTNT